MATSQNRREPSGIDRVSEDDLTANRQARSAQSGRIQQPDASGALDLMEHERVFNDRRAVRGGAPPSPWIVQVLDDEGLADGSAAN